MENQQQWIELSKAATLLGIPRHAIYLGIAAGNLDDWPAGSRTLVLFEQVRNWAKDRQ